MLLDCSEINYTVFVYLRETLFIDNFEYYRNISAIFMFPAAFGCRQYFVFQICSESFRFF